jgi:hypothetical protein
MAYGTKPPMKNKPPMKKKKELTKRQLTTLEKHSVHHTKKHMNMMKKLMREGMSFTEAHKKTMKEIGK